MDQNSELGKKIIGLRMIVVMLFMGLTVISALMIFSATRMNGPMVASETLAYLFLGIGVMTVISGFAVSSTIRPQLIRKAVDASEEGRFGSFMSYTIIVAALLEGPAILLLVGFMITQNWLVLAPVPILMLMLLMQLPSLARFQEWNDRIDRVKQETSF